MERKRDIEDENELENEPAKKYHLIDLKSEQSDMTSYGFNAKTEPGRDIKDINGKRGQVENISNLIYSIYSLYCISIRVEPVELLSSMKAVDRNNVVGVMREVLVPFFGNMYTPEVGHLYSKQPKNSTLRQKIPPLLRFLILILSKGREDSLEEIVKLYENSSKSVVETYFRQLLGNVLVSYEGIRGRGGYNPDTNHQNLYPEGTRVQFFPPSQTISYKRLIPKVVMEIVQAVAVHIPVDEDIPFTAEEDLLIESLLTKYTDYIFRRDYPEANEPFGLNQKTIPRTSMRASVKRTRAPGPEQSAKQLKTEPLQEVAKQVKTDLPQEDWSDSSDSEQEGDDEVKYTLIPTNEVNWYAEMSELAQERQNDKKETVRNAQEVVTAVKQKLDDGNMLRPDYDANL